MKQHDPSSARFPFRSASSNLRGVLRTRTPSSRGQIFPSEMRILDHARVGAKQGVRLRSRRPALGISWGQRLVDDDLFNPVASWPVDGNAVTDHFKWVFPEARSNQIG